MKKLFILFLICSAIYAYLNYDIPYIPRPPENFTFSQLFKSTNKRGTITEAGRFSDNDKFLKNAFEDKLRNSPALGGGKVIRLLPDDFGRTKRQVFLISLDSGQRLKIKHEINNKKHLPLKVGDYVEFRGIYNWNRDGGVINKTHHEPTKNDHGWIKHNGITYK